MNIRQMIKPITISDKAAHKITNLSKMKPSMVRLLIGAPAFVAKPATDYFVNRDLDEDTRKFSASKTFAKVAVGNIAGVTTKIIGENIGMKVGAANTVATLATIIGIYGFEIPLLSKALDFISDKLKPDTSKTEGGTKNE